MTRKLVFFGSLLLLIALGLAWGLESRMPEAVGLTPALTGQEEYCLTCHAELAEISPSHPVESFGCVVCHGGERLALDADLAHSSIRGGANPSDLAVVEASCGGENCHSGSAADERDHIQRVMTSIQVNYTGAITSVRYTFGAQPDQAPRYGIQSIIDTSLPSATGILQLEAYDPAFESSPSVQAFGTNCLNCHINAEARPGAQYARLTGCAACHAPMDEADADASQAEKQVHSLSTTVAYTQCNTCHNRGNYDLGLMSFVERSDAPADRMQDYYQPIAQFTRCEYTLDCSDCHTRDEIMNDGDIHATKQDIQYIQCSTCHGTPAELPLTMTISSAEEIALRMAFINPFVELEVGDVILVTEQGEPLWNTLVLPDGTYQLTGKASGQVFTFRPVLGSGCTQSGEEQGSSTCHECHAVER